MFQRTIKTITLALVCAVAATACGGTAGDSTNDEGAATARDDEALTAAGNCDGSCPAAFTALWATTMTSGGKVMGQCEADVATDNTIEVYSYLKAKDIAGNVSTIASSHSSDQRVVTDVTPIVAMSWQYEHYRTLCHARHKKNDGTWTDFYSYASDWK